MKYTKEDLMNTWGVVESKEHVDCIVDLCESLGVGVLGARCYLDDDNKYFSIDDDGLCFWLFRDEAANFGEKKITIPLPPKAKEWVPEVGDKVLVCNLESDSRLIEFNNETVNVLAKTKDARGLILTISHPLHGVGAVMFISKFIKKPKTEQELKIEELQTKLCNLNAVDNYILACDIVQGKIEGLSYE